MNSLVETEQLQHYHSDSGSKGVKQKLFNWRSQWIELKIERDSRRLAKKLELNDTQQLQLAALLRQLQKMRDILREERRNSMVNLYVAMNTESFDSVRVGRGIDSSVERVHFHMDDILSSFSEWIANLEETQKHGVKRFMQRRKRLRF